jgi:spermidine synthase
VGAAWLVEALGNVGTVRVASSLQILAAVIALLWYRRRKGTVVSPAAPLLRASLPRAGLLVAAFLAGAAGLVVQIAWTRRLIPVIGSTYQVFSVVLAVQLLGLALGSLLLGPRRSRRALGVTVVLAALAAVPVALLPEAVEAAGRSAAASVLEMRAPTSFDLLVLRAKVAALLVLPSTIVGAALLPWLLAAAAPDRSRAGTGSGALLAANTAGSAVAALATALAWIPALGSAAALRGAAGLYLFAGAFASRSQTARAAAGLAGVLLLAQPWVVPVEDVRERDAMGVFYNPGLYDPRDTFPLHFREGPVATVVVRDREGRREFWIDGNLEASTGPGDRLHLGLLGHLPMALLAARGVERPRVSVVGLGAGFTTRAAAAWNPSDLSVHELEEAVVAASEHFASEGGGVPSSARVSIQDGRRGVARDPAPRDLVTSDPIHPSTAGSAYLYSLDHYRAVVERLSDDGVLCQWLPLYQMHPDDLRLVVRTFAAAVEHPYLFLAAGDGILIGTRRPLVLSEERLRAALEGPAGESLAALGLRAPGRLLALLVHGPEGCRRFAGPGETNTDDRLLLEFRSGRNVWRSVASPAANASLVLADRVGPETILAASPTPRFLEEVASTRRLEEGLQATLAEDWNRAIDVFTERAAADPADRLSARLRDDDTIEKGFALWRAGRREEAAEVARSMVPRTDFDVIQRLDVAELLRNVGLHDEGRAVAQAVLEKARYPRAVRLAAP